MFTMYVSDIDECLSNICPARTNCVNTEGSYACVSDNVIVNGVAQALVGAEESRAVVGQSHQPTVLLAAMLAGVATLGVSIAALMVIQRLRKTWRRDRV